MLLIHNIFTPADNRVCFEFDIVTGEGLDDEQVEVHS